jgi:hypothetical protein
MPRTALSVVILLLAAAGCTAPPAQPTTAPVLLAAGPSSRAEPAGPIAMRQACFCDVQCSAPFQTFRGGSNVSPGAACNNGLALCRASGCTTCSIDTVDCF